MATSYLLATTESTVRWYTFDHAAAIYWREGDPCIPFELTDILDLRGRMLAGDKNTAKHWAKAMGLTHWRYVRI
jgi:hypothetical protein